MNDSGITRKKFNNEYIYYYNASGKSVSNTTLQRIDKLKIPPAWNNVWIASDTESSIQATGFDSKNKKQYIYSEIHIKKAERDKFERLLNFIKMLPKLTKTMEKHKKLQIYDKHRVIATMLFVVRELHLRIGKECYAKNNKSYGISRKR